MTDICSRCLQVKPDCITAVVHGEYYSRVCRACLGTTDISSSAAGYERRRGYEDNAQDTIQPYDATGAPRSEFFRMYPDAARKVFTPSEIEQVKRKI
jgi:hypothetical protein